MAKKKRGRSTRHWMFDELPDVHPGDNHRGRNSTGYQPNEAVNEVKAVYNPNTGTTSNFFGGVERPEGDGEWHGHYDVNESGDVTYGRDPGERR